MDVKNEEEGPDETFKRASSYDAGTSEDLTQRYVRELFYSHVRVVVSPSSPSLRKIVNAFSICGSAYSDPRNMRCNDVA